MGSFFAFIKILVEVLGGLKSAYELLRKAQKEGWYNEGKVIAHQIRNAKNDEERRAIVRALSDHIHRMP